MFFTTNHPLCFLLIMVSFLTYLVILTADKTLLTFWLSLTYLFHVYNSKLKLKQDSGFYSHPGHCSLGGSPSGFAWISPSYLPAIYPQKSYPSVFYRHHTMTKYTFFVEKVDRWGKDMASLWGEL